MSDQNSEAKQIIGGIFGTKTKIDEDGNVVEEDEFHIRLYRSLWDTGAIRELKYARLHTFLTIVKYANSEGSSWPTQQQIADETGYNRSTISDAVDYLENELGLIESGQRHKEDGTFSNTYYKLKPAVVGKSNNSQEVNNKRSETVVEKSDDGNTVNGKSDTKEEPCSKEDFKTTTLDSSSNQQNGSEAESQENDQVVEGKSLEKKLEELGVVDIEPCLQAVQDVLPENEDRVKEILEKASKPHRGPGWVHTVLTEGNLNRDEVTFPIPNQVENHPKPVELLSEYYPDAADPEVAYWSELRHLIQNGEWEGTGDNRPDPDEFLDNHKSDSEDALRRL